MSGPREPWRSRGLGLTVDQLAQRSLYSLRQRSQGIRPGRDLPDDLSPIKPRETRERDRSLNGKARRSASRSRVTP